MSVAQDQTSLKVALGQLKQAILSTPGAWPGYLSDIATAYRSIGELDDANQALSQFETAMLASLPNSTDPRNTLRVLTYPYERIGNFEALARLAPRDPQSHWAVRALIYAGDKSVLMELLSRPRANFVDDDVARSLAAYVEGIAARQGARAGMQSADELAEIVTKLVADEKARLEPGKSSYAVWMMEKGWPKSIEGWLTAILIQANREDRTEDALQWASISKVITLDLLDRAIAAAIVRLEKDGDGTAFDRLAVRIRDHKARASAFAYAALYRLKRGRPESASKPAALFVNDKEAFKQGASLNVEREFWACPSTTKTGLVLDRHHKMTPGDGLSCFWSYGDKLSVSLGPYLAKANLTDLARIVLDYALVLGRIPGPIPDPPLGEMRSCPDSYPGMALAESYLRAGAKNLVREYAEHLAYVCPINESSGFRVGWLLALLDSPDAVRRLLQSRSYTSAEAAEGLKLGLAEALAALGNGSELEALLPTIVDRETAIYRVNLGLPDLGTPDGRLKANIALKATLPHLAMVYLKPDREDLNQMRAPGWLLNAVRVGLAAEVQPMTKALTDQTVSKLNALGTLSPENSFELRKYALGLATLFLGEVQARRSIDPSSVAARIKDDYARFSFLAAAAEALAISGHIDAASDIATQIPDVDFPGTPGSFFRAPSYAWRSIGEAIARAGDLPGAFRFLESHKQTYPLPGLIDAYRDGLVERATPASRQH